VTKKKRNGREGSRKSITPGLSRHASRKSATPLPTEERRSKSPFIKLEKGEPTTTVVYVDHGDRKPYNKETLTAVLQKEWREAALRKARREEAAEKAAEKAAHRARQEASRQPSWEASRSASEMASRQRSLMGSPQPSLELGED